MILTIILTRTTQLGAELELVASLTGGKRSGQEVAGHLDGVALTYSNRATRSSNWTEVNAQAARGGVELVLRPRRSDDEAAVNAGRLVDVDLGDAELRKAYVVDGAPADAVAAVLDADVRKQVLELRPGLVHCSGERVRVVSETLVRDDARATALLHLTAALAKKVAASGAAEAGATAALRTRHDAERDQLFTARAADRGAKMTEALIVAGVLVLLFVLGLVWAIKRRAAGTP